MPPPIRNADPGYGLYEIATHFVVHCPKCTGRAFIKSKEEGQKLVCTACFYVEQPGHWYGAMTAYVSVKCRQCHAQLQRSSPWDGHWKKLAMHCHECGDDCEYEAHTSRQWMHNGLMCDPVFGLPLWLQKEFRGDVFWAYHYEHLSILEQYIAAKLRERGISPRNVGSKNRSLLGRLPDFIKKAGNREALLKLVAQLMDKK